MKKWIVYMFLVCYLFSTTDLSELLKLDHVYTHFLEHQKRKNSINFTEFLYAHYINHGKDNSDDEKDKTLPFHSHSESCATNFFIPVILPILSFDITGLASIEFDVLKYSSFYPQTKINSYLDNIWQPPQLI